jgi:Ca-activated chloride channel family protein
LTDGRNNVGASTEEAIAYAKENDVTIDVVGVGTIEGAPFTAGIIAVSSIDEDALRFIAHESGGKYYLAKNKQELIDAFKELATLTDMKLRVNLSPYLLLLGLALLFIEFTLANTRYRIMP